MELSVQTITFVLTVSERTEGRTMYDELYGACVNTLNRGTVQTTASVEMRLSVDMVHVLMNLPS